MQQDDRISDNLCNLLENVCRALGTAVDKIFNVPETKSVYDLKDAIKKEIEEYRLEKIPKDEVSNVDGKLPRRSFQSYWREAYGLAGLDYYEKKDIMASAIDYDQYWLKVKDLKNEDGKCKFHYLSTLAFIALSLPHGNADPERGFSINKHLIERHGPNIQEDTIIAIRTIKDHLIRIGGLSKVEVTHEMLQSCKNSYDAYQQYLAKENKKENEKEKEKEKEK